MQPGRASKLPGQPTTLDKLPPELANHPQYEVLRELGQGGMGVVYLAKNKLMDRLEVLKVINKTLLDNPGAVERFLREIRAAAKLNHANIVTAYSALQIGDLLAFAMEFVEGEDLAALVKARGPLPVANACHYVQQAALGLQHAFEKGMIHRDIKPHNLILAREGKKHTVKVLDFGLARATREKQQGDRRLTRVGEIMGTPGFLAPEQTVDATAADIRADIYGLGCTLYYLLTGQPPYTGQDLAAILHAHRTAEPRPLRQFRTDVPEPLAAVVRRMMAKQPSQRYQTPSEVVQALAVVGKQGAQAPPPKPSSKAPTPAPSSTTQKSLFRAETILPSSEVAPAIASQTRMPPAEAVREVSGRAAPGRKTCLLGALLAGFLLTAGMGLLAGAVWMWKAGMFETPTTKSSRVVKTKKPAPSAAVPGDAKDTKDSKDAEDAEPTPPPKSLPVVLYPAVDQIDVPLLFVPELPDPLPKGAEQPGYPITATFPEGTKVEDVKAALMDNAEGPVEIWLSTPANPALTREQQGNTVCLIPRKPLRANGSFGVSLEAKVDGKPWRRGWGFATGKGEADEATVTEMVLARLNAHRVAAGLARVSLNRSLCGRCARHAHYVVRNVEYLASAGDLRDETPGRPGYTAEGREAARQSLVSGRRRHPRDTIEDWMAAPLLRPLLLAPGLREVGVGAETEIRMGWATVLGLSPAASPKNADSICYPADSQKGVPLSVYSFVPGDKRADAGYPITITFPSTARVKDAMLTLKNDKEEAEAAWLSTPETPAAEQLSQPNTICLLPKKRLRPATTYSVAASASVDGMAWSRSWKFTTERPPDEAATTQSLLARVNAHRASGKLPPVVLDATLSRGCDLHARYLVLNADVESAQGLGMHDEDRRLPGYTAEGERAGKRGVISTNFDPPDSVDAWIGSFLHRLPFLDPRLKRIGVGYAKGGPSQGWVTVVDFQRHSE